MLWIFLLACGESTLSAYEEKVALLSRVSEGTDASGVESILGAPDCILRKSSPEQNLFDKGPLEPRLQSGWIYTPEDDREHSLEVLFDAGGRVVTTSYGVGGARCDAPAEPSPSLCPDGEVVQGEAVAGLVVAARHTPVCSAPGVMREGTFQPLGLPGVEQTGWAALADLGGGHLVGALDSAIEAPGWEVILVETQDGGRRWSVLQTLRKPYYMATVAGLTFDAEKDSGALLLDLEDDYGAGVAPGRYQIALSQGGAAASAAALLPD